MTSVYQLVATILPNGVDGEKVQHDLGIWTTLHDAKRQIKEFNMVSCGAGWSRELNLNIRAYVDMGPKMKSYFVLYNHWRPGLATKCARISFLEPKYELGASYNKSIWVLDDREKEILCEFLKSPKDGGCDGVHNVWQKAISAFNNEVEGVDDSRILPPDLPMPDYRRLS